MSRRTKDRVNAIDSFLRQNYSTSGVEACAKLLNEPESYIRRRAQKMKLRLNSDVKKSSGGHKRTRPFSEMSREALEARCESIEERYEERGRINSELRLENIKLIAENLKLKGGSDALG